MMLSGIRFTSQGLTVAHPGTILSLSVLYHQTTPSHTYALCHQSSNVRQALQLSSPATSPHILYGSRSLREVVSTLRSQGQLGCRADMHPDGMSHIQMQYRAGVPQEPTAASAPLHWPHAAIRHLKIIVYRGPSDPVALPHPLFPGALTPTADTLPLSKALLKSLDMALLSQPEIASLDLTMLVGHDDAMLTTLLPCCRDFWRARSDFSPFPGCGLNCWTFTTEDFSTLEPRQSISQTFWSSQSSARKLIPTCHPSLYDVEILVY